MFNDAMKKAIQKRRGDLEKGFSIKIEVSPQDDEEPSSNDEFGNKKTGLAPEVKDQEPDKKAFNPKLEAPKENLDRGDMEKNADIAPEKEFQMPSELPVGRTPMTLGEKATEKMKKDKKTI